MNVKQKEEFRQNLHNLWMCGIWPFAMQLRAQIPCGGFESG